MSITDLTPATPPLKLSELTSLASLTDHPRLRDLAHAADEAARQQRDTERRIVEAENALEAEEQRAAFGDRDDKRLTRARQAIAEAQSELRIALMRTRKTREAVEMAKASFIGEVATVLRAAHAQRVAALVVALDQVTKANEAVFEIEDRYGILPGGRMVEPLASAFWREFRPGGRYEYWRLAHGIDRR